MDKFERRLKIFLCHASKDKAAVRELRDRLSSDGFEPWLDEDKLLPGQHWQTEIPRAVRGSDVVLACISQTSVSKEGYVQKELKYALDVADEKPESTIFLIPVLLESVKVPERLAHLQYCDLKTPNGYEKLLRALNTRAAIDRERSGLKEPPEEAENDEAKESEIRYQYDGSAFGAVGEILEPIQHRIPTQAATVLSPGGGRGTQRVLNFEHSFNQLLSFKEATVQASGNYNKPAKVWETTITSVVEELKVAQVLTAQRLVARLQARQRFDQALPTFTARGCIFENLRIAGYPVEVALNTSSGPRFESYESSIKRYAKGIDTQRGGRNPKPLEGLHTSLVDRVDSKIPLNRRTIGILTIPTIGTFRLAELVITPGRQSLTMLRVTLNSEAVRGEFIFGGVSAGGWRLLEAAGKRGKG